MLKFIFGFGYAIRGIGYAIQTQRNLRIHLTALVVVVVFNCMAEMSLEHWCIELLCCMLVISLEMMNTALECACDKISTGQHALIRHAKDAAAGAVLVSAAGSAVIGTLLFCLGNYFNSVKYFLRSYPWVKAILPLGAAAAALFIFLPSILQKKQKT